MVARVRGPRHQPIYSDIRLPKIQIARQSVSLTLRSHSRSSDSEGGEFGGKADGNWRQAWCWPGLREQKGMCRVSQYGAGLRVLREAVKLWQGEHIARRWAGQGDKFSMK
jgi:hypothetical protein